MLWSSSSASARWIGSVSGGAKTVPNPNRELRRSSTVIGRSAGTVSSSSASSARSTRRSASSGSRSSTAWSRPTIPSSTSDIVATAVIGLVSDAMRKMADRSSGVGSSNDDVPIVSTRTSSPRATR